MVDFGSGVWLWKDGHDYAITLWVKTPIGEEEEECVGFANYGYRWKFNSFIHKEEDEVQISDWPLTSWREYD